MCRHTLLESGYRSTIVFGMLLGLASFYIWFGWIGLHAALRRASGLVWSGLGRSERGRGGLLDLELPGAATVGPARHVEFVRPAHCRGVRGPGADLGHVGGFCCTTSSPPCAACKALSCGGCSSSPASGATGPVFCALHSLVFRLGFVLTGPLVGRIADVYGFTVIFLGLGAFFAVALPVAGRTFVKHNAQVERN